VPIIIGSTQDEASLFTFVVGLTTNHQSVWQPMNPMTFDVHPEIPVVLAELLLQDQKLLDGLVKVYGQPGKKKKLWMDRVVRDAVFACSSEEFATSWSMHAPTWLYLYAFPAPPLLNSFLGSCHTCDVPVLFKNFAGMNRFANQDKFRDISDKMGRWWSNMARCGSPTCITGEPEWLGFDPTNRNLAVFEIEEDRVYRVTQTSLLPSLKWPSSKQCSFWRDAPTLKWIKIWHDDVLDMPKLKRLSSETKVAYPCDTCQVNEALLEYT